jgi:cellulose synthase/poly-beta-1,6-N-acetylglucosamine synthase-like glycosyltransferase
MVLNIDNRTPIQGQRSGWSSARTRSEQPSSTVFEPLLNEQMENLSAILSKDFTTLDNCIWTTEWLNEWTIHQSIQTYTIVEVEDSASESVFYHLRDRGFKNVFLKPDALLINRYVSEAENPIVIQKLILRSPLMSVKTNNNKSVVVPKLEKILVDVFCDDVLFATHKGLEQDLIFQRVLKQYAFDLKTFLAYAERRKRKTQIEQYYTQILAKMI